MNKTTLISLFGGGFLLILAVAVGFYLGRSQSSPMAYGEDERVEMEEEYNDEREEDGDYEEPESMTEEYPDEVEERSMEDRSTWEEFEFEGLENTSFTTFSIMYPDDWDIETAFNYPINEMRLSKDEYVLEISQRPMGGGACIFEGDDDFPGPHGDLRGKEFVEVETDVGAFRRTLVDPEAVYEEGISMMSFCQFSEESQFFQSPTDIGMVSYSMPEDYDVKIVEEMDEIIKTIEIQ